MTEEQATTKADAINTELGEEAMLSAKTVPLQEYAVLIVKEADSEAYDGLSDEQKLTYYLAWLNFNRAVGIPNVGDVIIIAP